MGIPMAMMDGGSLVNVMVWKRRIGGAVERGEGYVFGRALRWREPYWA